MADKKFADAALARFNGESDESPETKAEDESPDDEKESDAVLGKMAGAAMKRGDWTAFCAAIRKICEYDQ